MKLAITTMETKIESTVKGTRILYGDTANKKRKMINSMITACLNNGYNEIVLPILQLQETFNGKVGGENQKMMYTFKDAGERELCLAPEYTAIIMQLAQTTFKMQKDVKLFYVVECFRGEKPQAGRYRQFTQFGVEIINPSNKLDLGVYKDLASFANSLIITALDEINVEINDDFIFIDREANRGLDYYTAGKGFEITCPSLGAQKQLVGGGAYPGGIGFAIGIDRLLLTTEKS